MAILHWIATPMRIILIIRIASPYWRNSSEWGRGPVAGPVRAAAPAAPSGSASDLAHELRLQLHGADAVDLAVDVVVAIAQADVLDLGTDLDHQGRALD